MDEVLKQLSQDCRAGNMSGVQPDADDNSDDRKLIPVEENAFPVGFHKGQYMAVLSAVLIVVSHGKKDEKHNQVLENANNL